MLILNADDLGRDKLATDTTMLCYMAGRLSSASAMVFMEDSKRAAELALNANMAVGLHINFTAPFDDAGCPREILQRQNRLRTVLTSSKYALLFYHPFLRSHFQSVFDAQLKEFVRLYGKWPAHFDGHQHMHLATNMLISRVIPSGERVRRNFSFGFGEKNVLNRAYRAISDRRLAQKYILTDYFVALSSTIESGRLERLVEKCTGGIVELMTHTWNKREQEYLLSGVFLDVLGKLLSFPRSG